MAPERFGQVAVDSTTFLMKSVEISLDLLEPVVTVPVFVAGRLLLLLHAGELLPHIFVAFLG